MDQFLLSRGARTMTEFSDAAITELLIAEAQWSLPLAESRPFARGMTHPDLLSVFLLAVPPDCSVSPFLLYRLFPDRVRMVTD